MKFISKLNYTVCKPNNYRPYPTSAFTEKAMEKHFSFLSSSQHIANQHAFQCLGSNFLIEDKVFLTSENFLSTLYCQTCTNVDEARYRLFCTKPLDEKRFALCRDALLQHAYCSIYQAASDRRALMHVLALLLQTITVGE